ncbi:VapC toxin family PIN domain ribonuclease [Aestuariivirga litoralis]|uniref:Ribonuclease VapC n=1 Tax=Aestuariivirga litoralis TaxID=2650924 RepID=A0A2W2B9Q7_9HYPH|nr:type II toxin-antitoxin system VapC family toxin [Aestuariivirga litoralis]PZF76778.1 VapC toxin family PIN domain ribonuclease [Aestuariivirga litoralis]
MLAYLLDTDICIHALKKRNAGLVEAFTAHDGRMAVSDVTLFELYYGAERYDDPAARIAIIEGFAARLDVLPFDSRAAVQAGNIRATLERQGRTIGAYDLMIAAIARSQGLVLVTGNAREFERVEGLRVERWG